MNEPSWSNISIMCKWECDSSTVDKMAEEKVIMFST